MHIVIHLNDLFAVDMLQMLKIRFSCQCNCALLLAC